MSCVLHYKANVSFTLCTVISSLVDKFHQTSCDVLRHYMGLNMLSMIHTHTMRGGGTPFFYICCNPREGARVCIYWTVINQCINRSRSPDPLQIGAPFHFDFQRVAKCIYMIFIGIALPSCSCSC